ncbi:MAG: multiubiquitin domain-containing protein [Victivallaceae bacterium]
MNKNEAKNHKKEYTIIVNTQEKKVYKKELSFMEIVILAFEHPLVDANNTYTIKYRRGVGNKPEGILAPGQTVRIKEGEIFNVTPTHKS